MNDPNPQPMVSILVHAARALAEGPWAEPLGPPSPKPDHRSNNTFQVIMEEGTFLAVLEVNLSILCNSLPMLLPLYSFWRYRRVYGAGEDEYVSRVRGGADGGDTSPGAAARDKLLVLKNVTNGLPLETIYGEDDIHFVATVGVGEGASAGGRRGHHKLGRAKSKSRAKRSRSKSDGAGGGGGFERFDDDEVVSDGESTRRLSRNAGPAGIKIETKWTITEETRTRSFGP